VRAAASVTTCWPSGLVLQDIGADADQRLHQDRLLVGWQADQLASRRIHPLTHPLHQLGRRPLSIATGAPAATLLTISCMSFGGASYLAERDQQEDGGAAIAPLIQPATPMGPAR